MYITPEQKQHLAYANLKAWLDGKLELNYAEALECLRAAFLNNTRHTDPHQADLIKEG